MGNNFRESDNNNPAFTHGQRIEILIDDLNPNPAPHRKFTNAKSLEELEKSVLDIGLLHPVTFTENNGQLVIVSGERRFLACKNAGMDVIPAIYVDRDLLKISLAENFQRDDLTPMERAELVLQLKADGNLQLSEIAEQIRMSVPSASELLSLNRLPEDVKDECRKNPDFVLTRLVAIAKAAKEKDMRRLFRAYRQELEAKNNGSAPRRGTRGTRGMSGVIARIGGTITEIVNVDISKYTGQECDNFVLKLNELERSIQELTHKLSLLGVSISRNDDDICRDDDTENYNEVPEYPELSSDSVVADPALNVASNVVIAE